MDIKSFFKLVNKYKWVLILVPVIVVTVTYFLVQNLPKQYSSEVQISTGLLDPSKKVISSETVDLYKVSQQFNSIMEKIKTKKVINILSYNLILHELEQTKKPFKKYSELIDSLHTEDREEVIGLFRQKLLTRSILTIEDNKGRYKLYDIVESMGYGEDALKKQLDITHTDNSDNINIKYISPNPDLSVFVVNTLASEFISSYSTDVNNNQNNSLILLDSLLKRKEAVMNEKNNALSDFKRNKGVLNLSEQSSAVYGQISTYETQRADALKQIESSQGAIAAIDSKLKGGDPSINGSSRADNGEIINLKRQLQIANSALIDGGFKTDDQKKVDSLSRILSVKGSQNADENVFDPRVSKQSLVQTKLNMEIALQQAKSSIRSIDAELASLRAKYSSMVPYDADINNYVREADLATKDYMALLDSYNQTRTDQNIGFHLQMDQPGLPGNPEPSKRMIFLAGSGIGSFSACLGFLFVIFILDRSITNSNQLSQATKSKTIGALNMIQGNERLIREIWNDKDGNKNYEIYRDLLRSLRFEIGSEMDADESKILGITSLVAGEGKTFIAYNIAYAFAMTGKKILLIADELSLAKSNSKELVTSQSFQTFLIKKEIHTEDLITVMNKNFAQSSLLEIHNIKSLKIGFEVLRKEFDMIIVDTNSLHNINITKEWLLFTEKNIAVFESGRTLNQSDIEYVNYIKNQPGFIGWILNKVKFQ